jgi:acyl-CoA thioesterase FadM
MEAKLTFSTTVTYGDVDRNEVLSLPGLFRLLQEGAIRHANLFDAGTRAKETRGESWVLNRIAVSVARHPHYEDALRVETWSSGIRGFRGYREFRVFCGDAPVASGSSLWLYVNLKSKALVRVPGDILEAFPRGVGDGGIFEPELERLALPPPGADAAAVEVSVRYSDVDANNHVNNTAYFDFLQTALARAGLPTLVKAVRIRFAKEIPPDAARVTVRLDKQGGGSVPFSVEGGGEVFAQGVALL